jgi:hypothetical protein
MQLSSQPERVPDGVSSWLDGYYRDGWWLNNPFLGITAAPKHSVPDRQKRMQALGDSCTPQQAAVPLMRVKYLWDLIHE